MNESRRYITLKNPGLQVKTECVETDGEFIKFAKKPCEKSHYHFESVDECRGWMKKFEDAMNYNPDKKQEKTLHIESQKAVKITDDDFGLMKGYFASGAELTKADFKVYESWLAHNFVDRDGERFSLDVLKSFEKTIVGKSLLLAHNWGPPGEGRFFKAKLEKKSVEETLEMIGAHPLKDIAGHLKEVENRDGGIYWLVTNFYMLAENEQTRKIDAGITKDMSIGFFAPGLTEVKNSTDQIMWLEYVNTDSKEAEAIEGSFVFLGSQYGAQTKGVNDNRYIPLEEIKDENVRAICKKLDDITQTEVTQKPDVSLLDNFSDVKAMFKPLTKTADNVTINGYRHLLAYASVSGHKAKDSLTELIQPIQEVEQMKIELKTIEYQKEFDPADDEAVKSFQTELDEKVDERLGEVKAALTEKEDELEGLKSEKEQAENELKEFKNVFGDDATKETVESVRDERNELFEMLINEAAKYGKLAGLIEDVDEKVEKFKTMSVGDLKERLDEYKVAYDKKNPSKAKNDDHPAIEYQPKENFELD